jgi:hypothetical protein
MSAISEKQTIIAALIDLMHALAPGQATAAYAADIKDAISVIAAPQYEGTSLYAKVVPIRNSIASAISFDNLQLTPPQQVAWEAFRAASQHAYDDYWHGISMLKTLI